MTRLIPHSSSWVTLFPFFSWHILRGRKWNGSGKLSRFCCLNFKNHAVGGKRRSKKKKKVKTYPSPRFQVHRDRRTCCCTCVSPAGHRCKASHMGRKRMSASSLANLGHTWGSTRSTVTTPRPRGHLWGGEESLKGIKERLLIVASSQEPLRALLADAPWVHYLGIPKCLVYFSRLSDLVCHWRPHEHPNTGCSDVSENRKHFLFCGLSCFMKLWTFKPFSYCVAANTKDICPSSTAAKTVI